VEFVVAIGFGEVKAEGVAGASVLDPLGKFRTDLVCATKIG
jgi:hypothetical protein